MLLGDENKINIYFPMSARVLTPGHIKCLEFLINKGNVIVGLLTKKAMEGYKDEVVPYKDREFVLKNLRFNFNIVPQDSLNPFENLIKYKCDAIASGDGWEKEELMAIDMTRVNVINIKLPEDKVKKYSSSEILNLGM